LYLIPDSQRHNRSEQIFLFPAKLPSSSLSGSLVILLVCIRPLDDSRNLHIRAHAGDDKIGACLKSGGGEGSGGPVLPGAPPITPPAVPPSAPRDVPPLAAARDVESVPIGLTGSAEFHAQLTTALRRDVATVYAYEAPKEWIPDWFHFETPQRRVEVRIIFQDLLDSTH